MSETQDIAELVLGVAKKLGVRVEELGVKAERPAGPPRRVPPPEAVQQENRRLEVLLGSLETIPEEFRWADSLDVPHLSKRCDARALTKVRDGMAAQPVMTLIGGPSRAGKTTLATALFASRLRAAKWPTGLWAAAARLLIEACREAKLGEEPPGLARARRVEVLLLDDLGEELVQEQTRALVSDLIGSRHREHKTTIVTTGFPTSELAERYGDGVKERLTEKGRALVVLCRKRDAT